MKYIDAEKLIAEIERRLSELPDNCIGHRHAYKNMLSFIESLEKEQPDKYETALEKARGWMPNVNQGGHAILIDIFPELGEGLDPRYGGRKQEQPIKVYRVENEKEQKGLWRKFDGTWEPLFDMLTDGQCKDIPMEDSPIYREGGKQWFASAPSRETLQKWFSKKDLEELTAKGFAISEFEVVGHEKVSDFEYIFTRDNIISRTYLKVSDIYPQEQPKADLEKEVIRYKVPFSDEREYLNETTLDAIARHFYELGLNARKEK